MRVVRSNGIAAIALDDGPSINFCRPAVDPLFSSAADGVGPQGAGAGAHRHGLRWHARRQGDRRRRRPRAGPGRSLERGLGHARPGRACRTVLRRAAASARSRTSSCACSRGRRRDPEDYDYLRKLLRERSGLVLSAEKQYLVESRLLPVARRHGMSTLTELVAALKARAATTLAAEVVDAMTTNETFFFRDKVPFEHLRDTVHAGADRRARARKAHPHLVRGRVDRPGALFDGDDAEGAWSAQLAGFRVDILATDLVGDVLERARAGIYSQFEVQRGLPIQLLVKYFTQNGESWQIVPELRDMVQFRTAQPAQRFLPARPLRPGVLPQRADLFRSARPRRRCWTGWRGRCRTMAIWSWARRKLSSASPTLSSRWRTGAGFMRRIRNGAMAAIRSPR